MTFMPELRLRWYGSLMHWTCHFTDLPRVHFQLFFNATHHQLDRAALALLLGLELRER